MSSISKDHFSNLIKVVKNISVGSGMGKYVVITITIFYENQNFASEWSVVIFGELNFYTAFSSTILLNFYEIMKVAHLSEEKLRQNAWLLWLSTSTMTIALNATQGFFTWYVRRELFDQSNSIFCNSFRRIIEENKCFPKCALKEKCWSKTIWCYDMDNLHSDEHRI